MAPSALVGTYGGDDRRRGHAFFPPALHVGGVRPRAGHPGASEIPRERLLDVGVRVLGHRARLVVPGKPVDSRLLGDLLHLPGDGAGAGGARLGDRRHERPVRPLAARQHVLGEACTRGGRFGCCPPRTSGRPPRP